MLHASPHVFFVPERALDKQAKLREGVREWLEMLVRRYDLSPRAMAIKADVAPSTIYRALEKDGAFVMSTTILSKIAAALGEAVPDFGGDARAPAGMGFAEAEAAPYIGAMTPFPVVPEAHQSIWRIANSALDLEGYKPGDFALVDMTIQPEPGDVVCAQVYNFERRAPEAVLRLYHPPYLLTRSTDPRVDIRPLYIDGERVVVVGVVVRSTRERAA